MKTIFIQIASYRDPELIATLDDCIKSAKYPERLRFGIAWQHSLEDKWDTIEKYSKDSRFRIIDIDYKESKGVCWARNLIQTLYNNEDFTLQLDSHHRFVKNWDDKLIRMFNKLRKKGIQKPLITSYLPDYFPEKDPEGRTQQVWQMDFNRFTPEGYIFTFPSVIKDWKYLKEPIPARFYSAHFAFTLGQFCNEVPHDPEMYFHGEEPSIAARAYTWGYDLFHPHRIIAWHEYTRNGKQKHWSDHTDWSDRDSHSHTRYRTLHGMQGKCSPCTEKAFGRYYFGKVRTLEEYERYIGVRFRDKKVQQFTLDRKSPPNPAILNKEEYENSLLSFFKHCIDIHSSHFKYDDYIYWAVAFELNDGTVLARLDANKQEIEGYLKKKESNGWINIWREYIGPRPDKWVVWPQSEKHGYVERIEGVVNG